MVMFKIQRNSLSVNAWCTLWYRTTHIIVMTYTCPVWQTLFIATHDTLLHCIQVVYYDESESANLISQFSLQLVTVMWPSPCHEMYWKSPGRLLVLCFPSKRGQAVQVQPLLCSFLTEWSILDVTNTTESILFLIGSNPQDNRQQNKNTQT